MVYLHELLVPLLDVGRLLAGVGVVVGGRGGVVLVVLAPFNDFLEDGFVDLGGVSEVLSCGGVKVYGVWGRWRDWGAEELKTYVGDGHFGAGSLTKILHHVNDEHGALGDLTLCGGCVSYAAPAKVGCGFWTY